MGQLYPIPSNMKILFVSKALYRKAVKHFKNQDILEETGDGIVIQDDLRLEFLNGSTESRSGFPADPAETN